MTEPSLAEWNRTLVSQVIELMEQQKTGLDDGISRLRGLLAVNPGGPSVSFVSSAQENTERSVA